MLVGLDVQGDHFRRKPGGKFDSLAGDVAPAVDGNDGNGMLAETGRVDGNPASGEHFHGVVVAAHNGEENNRQGNEDQGNPSALHKFRNQNDGDRDAGDERAEPIDECALQPIRTAIFSPMHDHAGLRKREGQKRADGIERDQPVGDAAEKNEYTATQYRQDDDAVGVDEPTPAIAEDVREIVVLRDGATEARKISEGGIGGKRENDEDGADGQIIKERLCQKPRR